MRLPWWLISCPRLRWKWYDEFFLVVQRVLMNKWQWGYNGLLFLFSSLSSTFVLFCQNLKVFYHFFVSNSIIILLNIIFYFGSFFMLFCSISSFKLLGWLGIRFRVFFPNESSCTITQVTISKVKTRLTLDSFQVLFYIFFPF
jgi:hypothetical protein